MKGFFSYDENQGFERHETAAAAKADAESALEMYRDDACDGWPDEVNRVCWGFVLGIVSEVERRERCPDLDCDGECERDVHHCNDYDVQIEYAVLDTDSELARLRADLTALRERLRWVPVGERLPEVWTHVEIECRLPLERFWIGCLRDDGLWAGSGGANISACVVAWRYIDAPEPLPAAPEVQNG